MTSDIGPHASQKVVDLLEKKPPIPAIYANLMDIPDYFKEDAPLEYIPFYWHIPRSAGGMIKQLMGECRGLTLASWFPADILFGT
eukprot:CAMPEP_0197245720 /NCGR_PEP_ID=MMETSP1429-20130617/10423_1 /TAXON_ID=49237 /ORGANISM="Chaetoceros  sp., Strain UNC1202" /LENGTH=84 /DNA_ID=CAMNT_0042706267 /DNA_START=189 /DNA_END=439 /DNA_ORIENTATION=+